MKRNSTAEQIGYWLVMAAAMLLKGVFMVLLLLGKALATVAVPIARAAALHLANRLAPRPAPRAAAAVPAVQAPVSAHVPAGPQALQANTGPDTVIHNRPDFEGCDRIVSLRLDPPVGVINLRVFYAEGVVKRDLIVSEPHLKTLMGGRRHSFPDAPYERVNGMEALKDETIALAERLINDLGNKAVKGTKPRKDDFERARPTPTPVQPAQAVQPAPPVQREPAKPSAAPAAVREPAAGAQVSAARPLVASRMVSPTITTGFTYEGRLTNVGPQMQRPTGKRPFEVFEATLLLDNGAELSLRGAELERELVAAGCRVGNRVAITPMGKVPVQLASGEEGRKNLYRVANLSEKK